MARRPQLTIDLSPDEIREVRTEAVAKNNAAWVPSREMRRAKANFVVALRDDPLLVAQNVSAHAAASISGVAGVERWWTEVPQFRPWFLDRYESESRAEYLFSAFLDEIEGRMGAMSDKDLMSAGKLLAEIARKMPEKHSRERVLDAGIGQMSDEARRRFILEGAAALGLDLGSTPAAGANPASSTSDNSKE